MGKHIGWEEILKSSSYGRGEGGGGRGEGEGGLDLFYGGSWPLESPCKDFSLATGGGLGWMKWLNHRAGKGFIFHAIIPALFGKKFILNMPYTIT